MDKKINLRVQEDHSLLRYVEVDPTRLVSSSLFDLLRLSPEDIRSARRKTPVTQADMKYNGMFTVLGINSNSTCNDHKF